MKYVDLSKDTINDVVKDYIDGLTIQQLIDKHSISKGMVYSIIRHNNLGSRQVKSVKKRVCSKCGKTIKIADAKFCCYCGKKILTPQEIALESLDTLSEMFSSLKSSDNRDACIKEILKVEEYIKTGNIKI